MWQSLLWLVMPAVAMVECGENCEDTQFLQVGRSTSLASAAMPSEIVAKDLVAVHDLLLVGYYAPMTYGPGIRKQSEDRISPEKMEDFNMPPWPPDNEENEFFGLREARDGAIMLAKILKDVHPVAECRKAFASNEHQVSLLQVNQLPAIVGMSEEDLRNEKLVELQAASAWACIGIQESDVVPCGNGRQCGTEGWKPLTKIREADGSIVSWDKVNPYRNFELKMGHELGACKQPYGTGGPVDEEKYKERVRLGGKTAWLRACSYWSAFHTMGLRADALGHHLPNYLFGAVLRIIAGGALFCGG